MGYYRNHREYLIAVIRDKQALVDMEDAHPTIRKQTRRVLARLCGELDDLDSRSVQLSKEGGNNATA